MTRRRPAHGPAGPTRESPGPGGSARARRGRGAVLPVLAAMRVLMVRGVRRDLPLLAAWWVVVTLAVLVAVGSSRFATGVLDAAAREAVRDAGRGADVVVTIDQGHVHSALTYAADPTAEMDLPALRGVVGQAAVVALAGRPTQVLAIDGTAPRDDVTARPALLDDAAAARVRVIAGTLPVPAPEAAVVDPADAAAGFAVAVSEAHARAAGLEVGDVLLLPSPPSVVPGVEPPPVRVEVVAVVAPVDAADVAWTDAGALWTTPGANEPLALLAPPATAEDLDRALGEVALAVVRVVVDPERFTAAVAEDVLVDLETLSVGADGVLPPHLVARSSVRTGLGDALSAYVPAARAATAQLAVPTTGAVGAGGVVLVLLARLLVDRRRAVIELERARGAAVGTVVLRLAFEALVVTAAAVAAGLGALAWLLPGATPVGALGAVVATAVLATPAWGGVLARRAWSGVREPANRRDRARLARRRAGARLVGEATVLALAGGAAVALRGRGLLQTTTEAVDPFLAAAPLLIALAATLVVLRVYPWPVRAVMALARRSAGALGVVGTTRAHRALAPLPLLALTLATSVGVAGVVLVGTVRTGQVAASWLRVPADVVVTADDVGRVAATIATAPGVTAVATADLVPDASGDLGNREITVSVLAIDAAYAESMADVPEAGDLTALAQLADAQVPDGVVPAVVDEGLAGRIGERGLSVSVHGHRVQVQVVGTTTHAPHGLAPGPFVFVPLDAMVDDNLQPIPPTIAWAHGPGAAVAAEGAVAQAQPANGTVLARLDWLADRRSTSLVSGVERALVVGAGVAALLAAVAMAATALASSRDRGRTLALLRTLGMRPGLGWWLALVELAPVVVAATGAGALAGVAVVRLLGAALGLDVLVGGPDMPTVVVDPAALAWVAGAAVALLLVAVAVDVVAHRRDRLSDVLRVGETPGG